MYFTNQNILQSITGHILSISLFNPSIPVEIIAGKKNIFIRLFLECIKKAKNITFNPTLYVKVSYYIHLPKLCYVQDLYTDSNIIQHYFSVGFSLHKENTILQNVIDYKLYLPIHKRVVEVVSAPAAIKSKHTMVNCSSLGLHESCIQFLGRRMLIMYSGVNIW